MKEQTDIPDGIAGTVIRFTLLVAGVTLGVGALIGAGMTLLLGKVFGSERMALELLMGGIKDGLFWGSIWLPGTVLAAAVWRTVEARKERSCP